MDLNKIKYNLKWFFIKTNLFKHHFNVEGFVYMDTFRNPVHDTTKEVKWLGTVDVHCRYKDMNKKAIETFGNKYPRYRGYINLY